MTDPLCVSTGIPVPFRNTLFSDFDVTRRNGNKTILRRMEEWVPTEHKPALLLYGPPGVGKTMLASALLNEYHDEYPPSHPSMGAKMVLASRQRRCPVYFIQLAELIAMRLKTFRLHDLIMRNIINDPTEYLALDQLLDDLRTKVKVLVIDDVGKEHRTQSGFAQDDFDLLVRSRHNNALTTIYTTNLPMRRWASEYSDSMRSIIERSSESIHF